MKRNRRKTDRLWIAMVLVLMVLCGCRFTLLTIEMRPHEQERVVTSAPAKGFVERLLEDIE